ncbi:hypothetical protein KB206_13890 [Microvirga sp. STS02]|uniref:hypothetical protein n=1 Tax=Hymenobacter negativus TaxID=2795026 RepID=UPI0018DE233F|nr:MULTISPECIES: hypothetical protein [Bacteria]MBH8569978.1 hypothetical protein [Hymenobacter negativus]MBR7209717.1 hypothetical protein [Microvirga sp. STS02]
MPSPTQSPRPNDALLALRPAVPAETTDAEGTVGAFLHATLRPVLKLQNDLLLAVVADFVRDHHISLRPTDQHHQLSELLTRNTKLRYTVVGLVSGQFTADEYAFYRQHRAELNRRLLEMALRRVLDQADSVVALVG